MNICCNLRRQIRSLPASQKAYLHVPVRRGSIHLWAKQSHLQDKYRCSTSDKAREGRPFEHSCDFEVRDYELDQYGVVNNAVYSQYLQYGRLKFLHAINIDVDAISSTGSALALSELHLNFRAPLRSLDQVRCTSKCGKLSPARITIHQVLIKLPRRAGDSECIVLEADATVVSLDSQYRPRRFAEEVIQAMRTGRAPPSLTDFVIDPNQIQR